MRAVLAVLAPGLALAAVASVPLAAQPPVGLPGRAYEPTPNYGPGGAFRGSDYAADQFGVIRQRVSTLVDELDHLLEDVSYAGPDGREIYRTADAALQEALHFEQILGRGAGRDHVLRDFESLDRRVHDLLETIQSSRDASLSRGVARVFYADQRLHDAIAQGDTSDRTRSDVLLRQARSLDSEVREFARIATYALAQPPERPNVVNAVQDFAGKVSSFRESVERGDRPEQIVRDFEALDQRWHGLRDIRAPEAAYVQRRIERVDAVHRRLHELLGLPRR